jgi:hypothetical protein
MRFRPAAKPFPGFGIRPIRSSARAADGREVALTPASVKPLSLAAGDFNRDGYPDFVAGYAAGGRGLLTVHFGSQEAFAPRMPQSIGGIAQGKFPQPFTSVSTAIPIPVAPDMLAAGDFNNDGNPDILFAARDGNQLYLLAGDGAGNFGPPQPIQLPGEITALATAPFGSRGSGANLAVGVRNGSNATLLVYGRSLATAPTSYSVDGAIGSLAIGDLDGDPYRDIAVVAGGALYILHGTAAPEADPSRVEAVAVSSAVKAVTLGSYVFDPSHRTQIALLTAEGETQILFSGGIPATSPTDHTQPQQWRRGNVPQPSKVWQPGQSQVWTPELKNSQFKGRNAQGLLTSRLSGFAADDLLVEGAAPNGLVVLNSRSSAVTPSGSPKLEVVATLETAQTPVAILPMRLSVMGASGFVMLGNYDPVPIAADSQPGVTYQVTGFGDSQSGACTAPSGSPASASCTTFRAAVVAANANPGQDLIVFDGNGTITLSVPGLDDNAMAGDLDVTDALTIVGNGVANTIIQGGASPSTGIDKVFSFNPQGAQPGFPVSISGLTIQFGQNAATDFFSGDNEGGAFDFFSGSDGAGSLSVSNCSILQNSTSNGDGGGIALLDGGTVAITNSTISGNQANMQGPDQFGGLYGYNGGGIFISETFVFTGSVTIANSTIANNTAVTPNQDPPLQQGGGVYCLIPNITISGSTISGNQANSDGGGLYGAFFPDQGASIQGTSIIGNTSGGFGGGINGVFSINNSTVANNTAAGGGGGLYSVGPGATITNSRIVGNASTQGGSAADGDPTLTATVTAPNNWWGSNSSPVSSLNSSLVTFAPWLVMTLNAASTTIGTAGASTLTASIDGGSDGSTGFNVPDGTPVAFAATLGSVNPAGTTTTSGIAATTYTAVAAGSDTVSATIDSQTVSMTVNVTPATTTAAASASTNFSSSSKAVTLSVTVTSPAGTVNGGTVTFTLLNSSSQVVGTATTSAPVSGGTASVNYTVPPNTPVGSYTIQAVYSGSAAFSTSSDSSQTLTVKPVAPALTVTSFNVVFGSLPEVYNVTTSTRTRLPWEITAIQVVFSEPVASANINSLGGLAATGFSGLGTNTLTWTIAPTPIGSFTATLATTSPNALMDASSNVLNNGTSFTQPFKVLWGDFNDDGIVNASDIAGVSSARFQPYNIFADMNGDGVVNAADVVIVGQRVGK